MIEHPHTKTQYEKNWMKEFSSFFLIFIYYYCIISFKNGNTFFFSCSHFILVVKILNSIRFCDIVVDIQKLTNIDQIINDDIFMKKNQQCKWKQCI